MYGKIIIIKMIVNSILLKGDYPLLQNKTSSEMVCDRIEKKNETFFLTPRPLSEFDQANHRILR